MPPTPRHGYLLFKSGWPSNWHTSPFVLDAVPYTCVEQWMMAEKARLFGDLPARAAILATADPREQKRLGREVANYVDAVWVAHRYAIVLRGVLEKYRQNPDLRDLLLATGNLVFAEASPSDTVWGIGLAQSHPDATVPSLWRGLNLLGKATGEARAVLRAEAAGRPPA